MTPKEEIQRAEKLLTPETWVGHSGEPVTGEQAAHHLETALALVERSGWDPRGSGDEPDALDGVDEKTTLSMVRGILRWLRDELRPSAPPTLWQAMLRVARTADGDDDTRTVAEQCMRLIIRARTGALTVHLAPWEERRGRTLDEVRDLVTTAAQLARKHGPAGGAR